MYFDASRETPVLRDLVADEKQSYLDSVVKGDRVDQYIGFGEQLELL